ncbi:MAG TPA: tetratricopeptide repeat protein [Thermoanaerobaculia bacterium]|nr:tetratricopeptide repeat protein [Thermoanaerobaculia bacterium]
MRMLPLLLLCLGAPAAVAQEPPPPPAVVEEPPAAVEVVEEPPAADPAAEEFDKAVFFGMKFFELREYGSAYQQFAKADAVRPDHPAVLYNMALVLAKAGRYAEAQVKVDRYAQLYPAGVEKPLLTKLQYELEFQRELEKARQANQEYTELFNRGKFLYGADDLDAALKVFEQAERRRPNDDAAVFNQAVVQEKKGDLSKAVQRYRRYAELELDPNLKAAVDQRIFTLDGEIEDMRTKIVCSFCGHRLHEGSTWCHRCWRGPYLTSSPVWNSRPCVEGATATRSTYYSDNRLQKNDALSCLIPGGTVREALRYSPSLQRSIQEARKAEGWTYEGEMIRGWEDQEGNQLRYVQGPQILEKVIALPTGEMLEFEAHAGPGGKWLLDGEDIVIDGQKYTSRYTFDASGRISRQEVTYQNQAACNHVISMTAAYTYADGVPTGATIEGGYEGYPAEGSPKTQWQATVTWAYDEASRLAKEDLAITSYQKSYAQRPHGKLREETSKLYVSMRPRRQLESVMRMGDQCATSGNRILGNQIDLRPFYTLSPNLAMVLPFGVVRATVTFSYPDGFKGR